MQKPSMLERRKWNLIRSHGLTLSPGFTWVRANSMRRSRKFSCGWKQIDILTGDPQAAVNMRRAWDRDGTRGEVRWQLARRLHQSKSSYVSPVELAGYYAQLGDKERTLALLEEGYQQRATDILWIQQDPAYDFLHSDSRFLSIVQKIELAPAK